MSAQQESPAVAIARAHVEAWSNHDFDTARSLPADAQPIVPGSVRILASTGDDHNALLTLTMTMAGGPFGTGATAPCARLYVVDDNNKIKTEQVIFYVAGL